MTLHLCTQDQLGLEFGYLLLHIEIIISDQRFNTVGFGSLSNLSGKLTAVGSEPDNGKAHLMRRDPGCCNDVGGITKDIDPFTREIRGIDGACVPACARADTW